MFLPTTLQKLSFYIFNFTIFQINPDTGSESWNKTNVLGIKTLKMEALMETNLRVMAVNHKTLGSSR